jgi:hypothetical protein
MNDIVAMPKAILGKSPAVVIRAMYDPRPPASSVVEPQRATSATILAFQAPPDAVTAPVT